MPTCFSKDECDVMDSGNYKFGANQRNSLLMSQLSCFLSTHVSLLRFFYTGSWSMETVFLSRALHSNHLKTISTNDHHTSSPHIVGNPVLLPYTLSSLNQLETYHHGGSTPSCQALHPKQDVPACWEYAAKKSTPITPDHATPSGQPRHTPVPN